MSILRRFLPGISGNKAILSPVKGALPGEHDTRAAIRELSQAVRNDPDAVEIYLALGNLYRAQGDFERAVQIRSTLIVRPELDDRFKAKAYLELGRDYKRGGFIDRALQSFEQARRLGGDSKEIYESMARLYGESGNYEKAAEMYGKLDHRVAQAHYKVRYAKELRAQGNTSDADKQLRKALKVYAGSVEAWSARINNAIAVGAWRKIGPLLEEALSSCENGVRFLILERLLNENPQELRALGSEEKEKLCAAVIPVLESQPPDLILQYYGALFLQRCGNVQEANAWLAKCMVLAPDFWAARLELLNLSMGEQPLSPVFKNQLEFFITQAKSVKRFVCRSCGIHREQPFYVCPRCRSWHSAAFRTNLQE